MHLNIETSKISEFVMKIQYLSKLLQPQTDRNVTKYMQERSRVKHAKLALTEHVYLVQ